MIRFAAPQDIPALKLLGWIAWQEIEYLHQFTPEFSQMERLLRTDPSYCTLVAESAEGSIDGVLIGQLQRGLLFRELLTANAFFYVLPERRGTLVPARLLKAFEDWSIRNNAVFIEMHTANGGYNLGRNARFFTGLGYTISGNVFFKRLIDGSQQAKDSTAVA